MNLLQIHEPGQTPLPHADDDQIAVGIDLGTTNSVIAFATGAGVEVLHDTCGGVLIPSVVSYNEQGSPLVGKLANAEWLKGNKNAIASVKRYMGRGASEQASKETTIPHEGMVKLNLAGKDRSPVEISAEILKHLKKIAEDVLAKKVSKAVITVPAYFDDAARQATKDAAHLAGLEVLRLVNEPTAAALAYGLDNAAEGIYAIYDFGGGTFDISILNMQKGVFQVRATRGDTQLGGDDIDAVIPAKAGIHARIIKERLSTEQEVEGVTRAEFEKLIAPIVQKTIDCCRDALVDAKLPPSDIKGVVMVGGSTRIPLVRREVESFFGQTPLTNVDPDQVVAVGAALQARGLTHGSDNLLLDVVPLSLGLETMGGLVEKLIHRNSPIPTSITQEFTTYQDDQQGMHIHVVQGEREMVDQNRSLAKFELKGIPPMPAGIARIAVTFAVDADGLLTVSATEKITGIAQKVEVKPTYGVTPEEMKRMLLESMEHAKEDIMNRLVAEAIVEAERIIIELKSAIKQDAELLTPQESKLIDMQIRYLEEAMEEGDRERMDVEVQQLGKIAQNFAERRMNKAIGLALSGKHISEAT